MQLTVSLIILLASSLSTVVNGHDGSQLRGSRPQNSSLAPSVQMAATSSEAVNGTLSATAGGSSEDPTAPNPENFTEVDAPLKASSWRSMIKWAYDQQFCLSVDNNKAASGTRMQLWTCAGGAGQSFISPGQQLDYLKLSMDPYFCVVVDWNANRNGAKAQVWGPCNQWNQRWKLGGDGYHSQHSIEWSVGGKCLVVDGNRAFNGAKVQIWDCKSVPHHYRKWFIADVPTPPATPSPPTICPAGYTATTQNVNGGDKQWSNHDDIQGCADACTNRHGCDVFEYAVSGGEKAKCGTYTTGHTMSGTQVSGWRTCSKSSTPPTPPPMDRYPPSTSCDQACFFKGERHTCRDRVTWLHGQGQLHWDAIRTVNSECQSQCACGHDHFKSTPSPPTPSTPSPTICPAGYTATTQNVNGGDKQWSNHDDIQGCADACTHRHGCDVFEYAVSGGEKTKCGTYTTGHTMSGTQVSGWRTCSKSSTAAEPPCVCGHDSKCCDPNYKWNAQRGIYVPRTSCSCWYQCSGRGLQSAVHTIEIIGSYPGHEQLCVPETHRAYNTQCGVFSVSSTWACSWQD